MWLTYSYVAGLYTYFLFARQWRTDILLLLMLQSEYLFLFLNLFD